MISEADEAKKKKRDRRKQMKRILDTRKLEKERMTKNQIDIYR